MEPGCMMEQEGKAISLKKKKNCTETLQSALSNVCGGASSASSE